MEKVKACGTCIFQHPPMSLQFMKVNPSKPIGCCEFHGVVELDNTDFCKDYFNDAKEWKEREAYIAICPHIIYDWHCDVDYGLCMGDCNRMKKYDKEHGIIIGKKKET